MSRGEQNRTPVLHGYYLVVMVVLCLAGPLLLWLRKARAGLAQKLGFVPGSFREAIDGESRSRLWLHAVSVGELNAIIPLLAELRSSHPELAIFVSTTTWTGQKLAQEKCGDFARVFYFPFDLPWATGNWLDAVAPSAVVIAETEIWPGFMNDCRRRGVPVVLVNGRLSPRSFQGYSRWKWLFGPVIRNFAALAVQSRAEAERFRALAGPDLEVRVCGNMKLDGAAPLPAAESDRLLEDAGFTASDVVVVAGSTHDGEEADLLKMLRSRKSFRLVLAPRHPERFDRVADVIRAHGFRPRRFSLSQKVEMEGDVYLLDTIGQLARFYGIADIAFVGGTLVAVGGHNLAEPCAYGVPVLCGPHVHKQRELADRMLERGALVQAADKAELEKELWKLVDSTLRRLEVGEAGRTWLTESQGAVKRTLELLEQSLLSPLPGESELKAVREVGVRR